MYSITDVLHHSILYIRQAASKGRCLCLLLLCFLAGQKAEAQVNTQQVMIMGRAALYYDDYVTAIQYFNTVLEAKPYLADALYYRAVAKVSLEDYESADADLQQAILFNPFRAEYYQLRGLCRIHLQDYDDAIADYTRFLAENPKDQSALYNRILCRLEQKDFEQADKELDTLLAAWPKFTRAYLVKAQVCLERHDTLAGMVWIDSVLTINRREHAAWAFKGRYALQHDSLRLADSCYTQALRYEKGNADYYLERAQVRNAQSRYALAIADYDRVIEMIPQHFVAHYNRGLIRALIGDDNRAIADFDFVISQEPDNVLAIYNRAELRRQVGDYRGAIADYSRLIAEYPSFVYGYAQRSQCYRSIGDHKRAMRDELVVRKADYDLIFGNGKRRPVKSVRKRSEKALEQYDQLVEEDADTVHNYFSEFAGKIQNRKVERVFIPPFRSEGQQFVTESRRMPLFIANDALKATVDSANVLLAAGQTQQALGLLRDAAAGNLQSEAVLHYNIGCVEAETGSLDAAEAAFSKAFALDSQLAEALYNRAVVYLLLNREEEALPLLSKAGEMGLYKAYNLLKQAKKKH